MRVHYKVLASIGGCLAAAIVFFAAVVFHVPLPTALLVGALTGAVAATVLVLVWHRASPESESAPPSAAQLRSLR